MSKRSEDVTIVHLGGPTKRAASSDDYVDMEAKYASLIEVNETLQKEIARLREQPIPSSDLIRSFQNNFRIIEEEVERAKEVNRQNRNPYNASTTKQIEASRAMAKDAVLIAKIVCKVE